MGLVRTSYQIVVSSGQQLDGVVGLEPMRMAVIRCHWLEVEASCIWMVCDTVAEQVVIEGLLGGDIIASYVLFHR